MGLIQITDDHLLTRSDILGRSWSLEIARTRK